MCGSLYSPCPVPSSILFSAPSIIIQTLTISISLLLYQSPDIGQSVDATKIEDTGAGDQGIMFGYATDETPTLMPLTHNLATALGSKLTEVRKNGKCPWVRPDGKTQVTCEYRMDNGKPVPIRVHTVVISTQHR